MEYNYIYALTSSKKGPADGSQSKDLQLKSPYSKKVCSAHLLKDCIGGRKLKKLFFTMDLTLLIGIFEMEIR